MNGEGLLGFREFAKDYEIEYVERPGKRPKAVRIYVGPWYRFTESPETIRFLKRFYLFGVIAVAVGLLIPMCVDCAFTRIWYIQVASAIAWIPWIFAVCATWRLWTAKEKVNREHNALLGNRMSGATLVMAGFCATSMAGCVYAMLTQGVTQTDYLVCTCCAVSSISSIAMFSRRKQLEMERVEG